MYDGLNSRIKGTLQPEHLKVGRAKKGRKEEYFYRVQLQILDLHQTRNLSLKEPWGK